ncbi:MAG: hypothetical protein WC814_02285 [Candidatus Paceibacterota bacterium]
MALIQGSVDATTAVTEFQTLYDTAPNKEIQAKVGQSLIVSLFNRNVGEDRSNAIALAEKMVADTTNTPRSRAIVLTLLAALVQGEGDSFFRQYFSDATLRKYLPPEGTRTNSFNIQIKMFKDAEAIYPTPYAEYYTAYAYSVLLRRGRIADGSTSREDMAREVQAYIKKGDATIATDANYISGTLANFYYQRATSLATSGKVLGTMTLEERERAYADAIAKISAIPFPSNPHVIAALSKTRFKYAAFLLINTKGREADIQKILMPFSALSTTDKFVADYFNNKEDTDDAVALAKLSPEFKGFLLKIGWKL